MIHPVSVVIPHVRSRDEFFHSVCLPSVERANPAQIIVIDREGGACEKRNEGASKAMYDYLLFVDDDAELLPDAIGTAMRWLEADPEAAFAYGDTLHMIHEKPPKQFTKHACGWNVEALKRANYIDVTALIRKKFFPRFDPEIKRLQDWDLWLTIAARGGYGIYTREPLHRTHKIDLGISDRVDYQASEKAIREKHGI